MGPKGARWIFFLLIQTLPTFWAARIRILRIFGFFPFLDFWTAKLPGPLEVSEIVDISEISEISEISRVYTTLHYTTLHQATLHYTHSQIYVEKDPSAHQ